jgi:hypothetical protein
MPRFRFFPLCRELGPDVQLLNAYNQRRLGLRAVPIAAITGTVGRADLCQPARQAAWAESARYRGLRRALAKGMSLPPVELSLLNGHYYIRDGHHRVIAAAELGILEIDAEVIECLPAPAEPAASWHRARRAFERDTRLSHLHVRRPDGYELLRRQIAEHAWYLGERGKSPAGFAEAAARWEREVYRPVVADLTRRGLLERAPDLTEAELYLAVCDHKWYRSERLSRDVGFAAAVADFVRLRRHRWLYWLASKAQELGQGLRRRLESRASAEIPGG